MTAQLAEHEVIEVQPAGGILRTRPPMILHVRVVTGHGGGPEKTILNSPRFLTKLGYQSKLAYLHPPGDPGIDELRRRGQALSAEVISVPDRGPLDLGVIRRLIRICRDEQVAIWHGHDYKSNLLGLVVRRFVPMQLVTTLHGWTNLAGRMPLYVKLDKWSLKYYRAAICVSDDLAAAARDARVQPSRCHVVYNAIDTDDYCRRRTAAEAKRELGAPAAGTLIGAVGRLSPEKGFDLLIRAACQLRQAGHDVHLWIAGDGPARPDLQRLIGELGSGDSMRLLGHVADPKRFYEAMDIFALSSIREGLPNVVLEAMAMETPVVATRTAGVPRLVEDGQSGLLVEPGSIEPLVGGVARLVESPDLCRRLASAARRRVEEQFSFSRRMEKIVRIYDEVLGRPTA
jgi:glycosyltransferase involved in cell wall biosynthesis